MDESLGKTFSFDEARALIPWLREICADAELKLIEIDRSGQAIQEIREQATVIIQHWSETVAKLGALPKQPFTVDFNSGRDFFCWEYPEDDLYFRHDYDLGYRGRRPIADNSETKEVNQ